MVDETELDIMDADHESRLNDENGEYCEVCDTFIPGFKYKMCCNAFDCGCMGKPMEPCICSEECWNKLLKENMG